MSVRPGSSWQWGLVVLATLAISGVRAGETAKRESLPGGARLLRVDAQPSEIELTTPYEYSQVLLTGRLEGGESVDVTRMAAVELRCQGESPVIEISRTGLVRPRADGTGELRFSVAGHTVSVPVRVGGQDAGYEVSFVRDVMPVLSRLGCTAGTCHGSAKGKRGFKTSMRGNDPLFDHRALVDDLKGRRFDRVRPEESLFLAKISGDLPHEGGILCRRGEPAYELLKSWIAAGVQLDLDSPRVERLEIEPRDLVIPLPGMRQQVVVRATYTDGRVRDVTADAFTETSSLDVFEIDGNGVVTALRRGEAAILARFEGNYVATPYFVMGDREGFEWKEVEEHNFIDTLVYRKLRKIKSLPAGLCTDAEFLRRVYLDLTGVPPRPGDVRNFLMDSRDSRIKREEVIDRLIGSTAFVDHWANKWADLLQVNRKFLATEGARALRRWIHGAVASNVPYDRFVRTILTASGSTLENPPAAYYKVLRKADQVMENTTQLFLGIRYSCNKCHDHPFERWTQSQHWELAAFFARVGRKNAPGSPTMPMKGGNQPDDAPPALEEIIFDADEGEVESPYSGRVVSPAFPYEHEGSVEEGSRRARLASWLTSPENPYFARSFANRLWSYFLGVGLIEPVDDIRAGNPPTNPDLLDRLTREFIDSGFDVRSLMRTICRSRVYQHSVETHRWNRDDETSYSHALARRLPAEVLYDAIHRATGSRSRLPGMRRGARAAALLDPGVKLKDGFLDIFGRAPRESSCECERTTGTSLAQALNLVNGETVAEAVRDPENDIAGLLAVEKDPEKIVEDLFLSFFCRLPTEEERTSLARTLDAALPENVSSLSPEDRQELVARQEAWEERQKVIRWTVVEPAILKSAAGASLTAAGDGAILAGGESPEKDTYTLVAWTDLTGITGFRIEVLPDGSLKRNGPGRSDKGYFVLSEFRIAAAPASDPGAAKRVKLQKATASYSNREFNVEGAIDGKVETGWGTRPRAGKANRAVFEAAEDIGAAGGTILTFTLDQQYGTRHTLGRFRVALTTSERPVSISELPFEIATILAIPREKRTPGQKDAVYQHYIGTDAEMRDRIRWSAAQDMAWALINNPAFLFNR